MDKYFIAENYDVSILRDKNGTKRAEMWMLEGHGPQSRSGGLPSVSNWDEHGRLLSQEFHINNVFGAGNDGIGLIEFDPETGQQIAAYVAPDAEEIQGPFPARLAPLEP